MQYYPRDESPFWVEVAISKANGGIETRKYRGKELLPFAAFGRDFRTAMIHGIQGWGR
jgi:hypothetical protein